MNGQLYEEWLKWFDRQMAGRKVLLFVDNAPAHQNIQLKNVTVKYLPANTTSFCQPMDQGLIQAMKLKYRKRQLQHVLLQMEKQKDKSGDQLLKDISVLDAICWVAQSWKEVEVSTVVKCFAKAGFSEKVNEIEVIEETSEDVDEDDDFPLAVHVLSRQLFGCDLMELIKVDKEFATSDTSMRDWEQPASKLLEQLKDTSDSDEEEEDVQTGQDIPLPCSVNDCLDMISKLKVFATSQGKTDIFETVMDLEDKFTHMKVANATTQRKISDFFTSA